jgi:hypothetical protein
VLNVSFCVKLLLLCFFMTNVARSFEVVAKSSIGLQATVLLIAIMFDSFIPLLILLAPGLLLVYLALYITFLNVVMLILGTILSKSL